MDADLQNRLIYECKLLNKDMIDYRNRLEMLDAHKNCLLKENIKNGRHYYSMKSEDSKSYKYIGRETPRIMKVKEAAHLSESIHRIEGNLTLVTSLLEGYQPYDLASVDSMLPASYRNTIQHPQSRYRAEGMKWKSEKLKFQAAFPENHPELKTEPTSDGTLVKSKNEVILYDRMLSAGLIHIYELPLIMNDFGPPLYPDITVLSPLDLTSEIIVECVGMLDEPRYRDDFSRKTGRYIKNGFIPGVNLLFVFCDKKGHLDHLQISKVIADTTGVR